MISRKEKERGLQHSSSMEQQQDAVLAASTAIMGENVLDSPTTQHLKSRLCTLRNHSTLQSSSMMRPDASSQQQQQSLPPNLQLPTMRDGDPLPSSSTSTNDTNALSVGIMAQGLAWAQMQKNRRQRLFLQHQAEQQLEKIRLAEEARQAPRSSFMEYIPSFSSILRYANLSSSSSNAPAPCHPVDSSSTILPSDTSLDAKATRSFSQQFEPSDSEENNALAFVSPSGVGYSVELPSTVDTSESLTRSQEDTNIEEEDDDDISWIPPVRIEEELPTGDDQTFATCPYILSPEEMYQIAIHVLPRNIAYCKWKRCYSLARDGDSFDTCLRAIEAERQTLLVLRTAKGERFGGYADAPWEGHSANYCGGPETCLFRIVSSSAEPKVICYRWTGANRYIQLCDVRHKMLAFGGGGSNGAFGLCLEQDFQFGSTGTCATFDNDPLCVEDEQFQIVDLEMYGFLLGQF